MDKLRIIQFLQQPDTYFALTECCHVEMLRDKLVVGSTKLIQKARTSVQQSIYKNDEFTKATG